MAASSLHDEILAIARRFYGHQRSDAELLALDPNEFDADPNVLYELLAEKYGVKPDPDNDYFGGFGGSIDDLIGFIELRWDGKTCNETPPAV
jgi:hypothetical protein